VRNSNPGPGVREAARRHRYSLSPRERGGVRRTPRRHRYSRERGGVRGNQPPGSTPYLPRKGAGSEEPFLFPCRNQDAILRRSLKPLTLPSPLRGEGMLSERAPRFVPIPPWRVGVRGNLSPRTLSLSLLVLRYIFAGAAAALVDFPSMMSAQLFPSSDISYLKLYEVGESSVME
jgi:hypothetical protein